MSSQDWIIYEKIRARFERKFAPKIYKSIRLQFFELANAIEQGKDISTMLNLGDMGTTIQNLYVETGAYFARNTTRELGTGVKRFNVSDKWVSEILQYFRLHLLEKAVVPISETTRDIVLNIIQRAQQEGWGVEKTVAFIRRETVELSRIRARLIVRTETGKAANLGKWMAAANFDYATAKRWVTAGDHRVRPQIRGGGISRTAANHMILNRQVRGLDEPFTNGLQFPGDPNGGPDEVCNCRCTIVFETIKDSQGNPIRNKPIYTNSIQRLIPV